MFKKNKMINTIIHLIMLTSICLGKEYLAVMTLESVSIDEGETTILSERITNELIALDKYIVIERSNVDQILKEQKFQSSGCTDTKCAVEIGKILNSNYIVIGNVGRFGNTYTIDCRMIDVETSEAVSSASYTTKGYIDDLLSYGTSAIALGLCTKPVNPVETEKKEDVRQKKEQKKSEGKWFTSKNTSFGLFDEKFGLDFFSLSRTIYEDGNDEIFVGFGTSIFISTQAGIGWKRYYDTDKKLKPFSCISMFDRSSNKMAVTNGDSVREDNCIGLSGGASLMLWDRKEGKRDLYLNIGCFASYDFRNEIQGYPFINLEFKN